MILYLISGRGFTIQNSGRKISEVIRCFRDVTETDVIFGGNIPISKGSTVTPNKSDYHRKWYRRTKLVLFFSESFSELKSLIHNLQTYLFLKKEKKNYELVWERSSGLHWAGILYAKRNHIPSVLEWKDHLIKDYASFFKPLSVIIESWKIKNATYIAVESKVLKIDLIRHGVPEEKIYVTYNAVNPEEFRKNEVEGKRVREQLGISDSDILIGYVGSYAFYHDSIRMLEAALLLREKGINNIKWLLIGDGKDRMTCEEYAKKNGLLDNVVKMLPFQEKERIPSFLSAMDVTILPGSTTIICPIKVMEYMSAESVVLVPDYECNREIIDGNNGLLFEPGNARSIADMLVRLSRDKTLCQILGKNARKTVIRRLTWDKTYGAVLSSVLISVRNR